jgi:hypothetical protein
MDMDDLARWAREKDYPEPRVLAHHLALLRGYVRVWNYRSKARKGGAANVQLAEEGAVYGLALEVDDATLELIDRKEGHPGRYSRGDSTVEVSLVHQERVVSAWVYQVTEAFLCSETIAPRREYLDLIIKSARRFGFPEKAIEDLERTTTV